MIKCEIHNGLATLTQCPRIILKGNAYQRGFQYGKAFARYLPAFYDWFVGMPPAEVLTDGYRAILDALEQTMHRHYPLLFDEIKGRADGSGMSYEACRILAFHNDIRPLLKTGCSNVLTTCGPDGPWMARTCDLYEQERVWQMLRICLAEDSLSYAVTGYLGLMNGIGVNSAGLAVGGSSSSSSVSPSADGLVNSAVVMLATLKTTADCCRLATEIGLTGKGANSAVLDAAGDAAIIEYAPGLMAVRHPDETGFLACTNHSITGKIPPSDGVLSCMENSQMRYDHLCAIVGRAAPEARAVELAKCALADHAGEHHVCQHIPGGYNTIYAWVIQPGYEHSIMHFHWGYPCGMRYETIDLDWKNASF